MKKISLAVLIVSLALAPWARSQPEVLASIKPLQLIAAAVTDGVRQPELLMRPGADTHHYSMRPSERAALDRADIVLWVGPALEGFMARVLPSLEAEIITALELPGLTVRRVSGTLDPHVWLDSHNARRIARALSRRLAELDPANARAYSINLEDFEAGLDALDDTIGKLLAAPGPLKPYAVYHDAFQYYEARYNLSHAASFTDDDDLSPGVRRMLEVRRVLEAEGVGCILIEPSVNRRQLENIVDDPSMRFVSVDVLGRDIPADRDGYGELLRSVTFAMLECVG